MEALEARLAVALQAQVPRAKSQTPKESVAEERGESRESILLRQGFGGQGVESLAVAAGAGGGAAIPLAAAKDAGEKIPALGDLEDDSVVAAPAEQPAASGNIGLGVERGVPGLRSFSEGGPDALDAPWPGTADETAFLAGQREEGVAVPTPAVTAANDATDSSPLPSLNELVSRIPAEAREALDDLFRAKFTAVRRVSKKSLKI